MIDVMNWRIFILNTWMKTKYLRIWERVSKLDAWNNGLMCAWYGDDSLLINLMTLFL